MKNTIDKPIFQEFHIDGVKHISPLNAFDLLKNNEAILIDVREANEIKYESIDLENVLNHPMSLIAERLNHIAKNQNIILVCPGGVRSTKVANMLNLQGYPNVANIDGGFYRWVEFGLPFKTDVTKKIVGCGCGGSSTSNSNSCCDSSENNNKCC